MTQSRPHERRKYNPKVVLFVLSASVLRAVSRPFPGCERPVEERLAALAPSLSAERGELPAKTPRQELYVGEVRDALMPGGPACPRCRSARAVRYGTRGGIQRYRCEECSFHFTDLSGTILHGLRRRDLWLDFCLCMVDGLSVRETARRLGISKNTAFAWRHRLTAALALADSESVCNGIVETAQWPIIRSFKGSRVPSGANVDNLDQTTRRNQLVYRRCHPKSRLATFVVAVDRPGRARAGVVLHKERLSDTLRGMVSEKADLCARNVHASLSARMDWPGRVNWIGGRKGRSNSSDRLDPGPLYHVRNARSLMYRFRYWLRSFRGVATKYLLRYFSWHLRTAALSHTAPGAAAKLLLLEALKAYSQTRPG